MRYSDRCAPGSSVVLPGVASLYRGVDVGEKFDFYTVLLSAYGKNRIGSPTYFKVALALPIIVLIVRLLTKFIYGE